MKEFQELIKEICQEQNITCQALSQDFILKLEKNKQQKYIYAYKFPLNDHGIGLIMDDKYAFYSVLKDLNIKSVEIIPIFPGYDRDTLISYLKRYQRVILKPNNGTCGHDVFVINSTRDLFLKLDYLLNKNAPVCLSPYYDIKNEYRLIVLNGQIKVMYGKKRPIIIGDGVSTIKTLLKKFNGYYYSKESNLEKLNFDLNKVLKKGEELEISFKFNLANGSTIFDITDKFLEEKLLRIAKKIIKKLNIQFASIDIIDVGHELLVLEANSGVMMDNYRHLHENGYTISKKIYQEAIISLFE